MTQRRVFKSTRNRVPITRYTTHIGFLLFCVAVVLLILNFIGSYLVLLQEGYDFGHLLNCVLSSFFALITLVFAIALATNIRLGTKK